MKSNLIIAIMILSLTGIHCSDSPASGGELNPQLIGTWEWTKSTGGFSGGTYTPQSEGYSRTLIFTSTGRREVWQSGVLLLHDSYSVVTIKNGNREVLCVDYASTSISPDQEITFDGNAKLILADRYMDGFTEFYTKIH